VGFGCVVNEEKEADVRNNIKQRFKNFFSMMKKNSMPSFSSTSKAAGLLLMLLMTVMIIGGVKDAKAVSPSPIRGQEWIDMVNQLRAKGMDVRVMKSKNMTPEKSPAEFLKKYKKIKDQKKESFTFPTFVEDVARGWVIEERYHEYYDGIYYATQKNLNPNYILESDKYHCDLSSIRFNCKKFCITPGLLRKIFGKEDEVFSDRFKKDDTYFYHSMDISLRSKVIPGINKECVFQMIFRPWFFIDAQRQYIKETLKTEKYF